MPVAGETFGHYEILKPLGKGGMGEVFLAQDKTLDRKVAIKFLPPELEQDPVARQRFLAEAKAVASLDHPFICDIFEIGDVEGRGFFVMEFVEGETLEDVMARGPIPTELALRTAEQIAQALEVAHDKGIVHRDLKPPNIMLTRQGHPKVMDFGIAKKIAEENEAADDKTVTGGLTQAGSAVGTINYMSPEQARGEEVDARSDIFAFGVLLHEMLSGAHPFKRGSGMETISAILKDPPPELEVEGRKKAPVELAGVLTRCLNKDVAERYPSMGELIKDLRRVRREMSGGAKSAPKLVVIGLAAVALLAIVAMAVTWFTRGSGPAGPLVAPEPLSVLVADFENRTGDDAFDGALEQAMVIGLEDASFITSYKRGRAKQVAEQIQGTAGPLGQDAALLVAHREGIDVIVAGFVESQGSGFQVVVDALEATTGESIKSESAKAGSKSDVLGSVGKLAVRTRKALGDNPPATAEQDIETFTAGNLDAARAYSRAQDLQAVGEWTQAIDQYSLAVQLDPQFGRAYAGLASSHANMGQLSDARKNYETAMANIDRMTDREKYRTRGGYYLMIHSYVKASDEYKALVEKYPADLVGLNNLGVAYFYGRNLKQAMEIGGRVLEGLPGNVAVRGNFAQYALVAGEFETALTAAEEVLEAQPSYVPAHVYRALALVGTGKSAEAADGYKKMRGISGWGASLATTGLADLAVYEGRLEDAAKLLQQGVAGDEAGDNTEAAARKNATLARVESARGQRAAALAAADRAVSASEEPRVLFEAGLAYLESGQAAKAKAQADKLGTSIDPDRQLYARLLEGELQLEQGNLQEAIRLFQQAQEVSDSWFGRFGLGRAYLAAEAFTEAYSEFDVCNQRRGEATMLFLDELPTIRYAPQVFYYLARAQAGLNSPSAAESFKAFLAIQQGGEATALVADARTRLAALGS